MKKLLAFLSLLCISNNTIQAMQTGTCVSVQIRIGDKEARLENYNNSLSQLKVFELDQSNHAIYYPVTSVKFIGNNNQKIYWTIAGKENSNVDHKVPQALQDYHNTNWTFPEVIPLSVIKKCATQNNNTAIHTFFTGAGKSQKMNSLTITLANPEAVTLDDYDTIKKYYNCTIGHYKYGSHACILILTTAILFLIFKLK